MATAANLPFGATTSKEDVARGWAFEEDMVGWEVTEVPAAATHDLRRAVLRDGRPDADVHFSQDERPDTFHLAVVDDDGSLVAVATLSHEPTPRRPGGDAWRLRGMAVDESQQGRGVGSALLTAAVERVRSRGATVLWADGRDTALAFYQRHGWVVEGDQYVTTTGIPHHLVVLDLST